MENTDEPTQFVRNIEWDMMDKTKFFPLSMLSSFCVRFSVYPLTLIKTRLQVEKHGETYKGNWLACKPVLTWKILPLGFRWPQIITHLGVYALSFLIFNKFAEHILKMKLLNNFEIQSELIPDSCLFDAATKIYKTEGLHGLYRGFWVRSVHVVSGVCYIGTYQGMRHVLSQYNAPQLVMAIVGGSAASLVSQTVIVPFDVLSQHLMVLGLIDHSTQKKAALNTLGIKLDPTRSKFHTTIDIAQLIYRKDGFRGFYRGFLASAYTYVPNSALWWTFYHLYQDELELLLPKSSSRLLIQCVAGMLGGFTTTVITNPMDTIRARMQVQRTDTILKTFQLLWKEDGMLMFTKGLTARLVQSVSFSFYFIVGYETVKRFSIKEEYKHLVRW